MKYELMFILDPRLTEKELEKVTGEIKSSIKENKFDLADQDFWGKRDLAYKIKGHTSGIYHIMNFTGEPDGMPDLHRDLRIQAGVLRYMLIRVAENYVLHHFSTEERVAKPATRKLKSRHAEELSKKVTSRKTKTETVEKAPEATETKKLDDSLQAIIGNPDIEV